MSRAHKTLWGACALFIASVPAYLYANLIGPDPRYTGAPGDNQLACAACHSGLAKGGPINPAGGAVTATFSGGSFYTPGVAQTITVSVSDPVNTHFGFQMTARLESNLANGQAGDFTPAPNQIVLCDNGSFKGAKGCPANAAVQFIEQSFAQSPPSATPYTFTWTPPATNAGNIHFYVAGNAVNNNDQSDAGDHVYTKTYVLTPAAAGPPPTVADGGVLNAASFAKDANGHGSPVAPGSLIAIFGTFAGASTADATTVPLLTSLGGVSVTFNGIPAPVRDVIPTGAFPFVNAQMPFEVIPGTVNVIVTVNGVQSAPKPIPIAGAAPGLFTIPPTGQGNAILVFVDPADGIAKIAAPTSASASIGYPTAPIPRGQSGFFYATGLGVMTPPIDDGKGGLELPLVTHFANAKPTVLIGGITSHVDFAGQAPGYPGVDQVNIVIPNNAQTGNAVPLQVQTADGTITSTAGATIAIR